jgi:hypothetical protein
LVLGVLDLRVHLREGESSLSVYGWETTTASSAGVSGDANAGLKQESAASP